MLTKLSLWGIYFASYIVDYLLILIILVFKRLSFSKGNSVPFIETQNLLLWGTLLLFVIVSIIITICLKAMRMNTRVKIIPERDITLETSGYILMQIITFATMIFLKWWIPIDLVIFFTVGIYFVKSNAVYASPLFVFPLGCHILKSGQDIVITKCSLQEMRIRQEDSKDGMQARELTPGVYFIKGK